MDTIKAYYWLAKPGIVYGNILTTAGGFLFAADGHIKIGLLLVALSGTGLVIASACVFNNYIDRDIDSKMERTKKRASVSGKVPVLNAMAYATALGLIGFGILATFTNLITVVVGLIGMFFYVVVYGAAKRRTIHSTLIGTVSGATPIVAGYTTVANNLDVSAGLLFLIMVCWQMPHFYAISMYRKKEYAAARLPVLAVERSVGRVKAEMMVYTLAFTGAVVSLTLFGAAGYSFLLIMVALSFRWVLLSLKGFKATDNAKWARGMFGFSLVILLAFSCVVSAGSVLP